MKIRLFIAIFAGIILLNPFETHSQAGEASIQFDFSGFPITLPADPAFQSVSLPELEETSIRSFYQQLENTAYEKVVASLLHYKREYRLDDWLYYQLIRKTASQVARKELDYPTYTLYKWFLLLKSGYDATLKLSKDKLLFYVRTRENIYNIPCYKKGDREYVCLNYHDYGAAIDFSNELFNEISIPGTDTLASFSYKVQELPAFHPGSYEEKELRFQYGEQEYHFLIKINPDIRGLFANYPVLDYEAYFNVPLSAGTYNTLIPALKKLVRKMSTRNGVDYLMRFTRYAFLYGADKEHFGSEKRLTPEQTLLYDKSDCEDRAALFFYLVREIYNIPMIVLAFPTHVTIAVKFDKPVGQSIVYNGEKYSVCEPTPQENDLKLGQLNPGLHHTPYEVVYAYQPAPGAISRTRE